MKKNLKNIISLSIIVSLLFVPFFETRKVYAQSSSSASSYITGLLPTILKFPGCKKNARKASIDSLFSGADTQAMEDMAEGVLGDAGAMFKKTLTTTVEKVTEGINSVPTYDENTMKELITHGQKLDTLLNKTADIRKSTSSMDVNDNCMNAIGKAVAKILIQKLTLSIVEWIQTGNSGGPMFVQDPSKFFKDIAKEEILGFGIEIQGSGPFAKNFLINQAKLFNQHFADNARYSLNEMIQETNPEASAASFSADFSMGGWGAWEALTQVPANNPLGFQIAASNELGKRLEGTMQSTAELARDQLQQAGGFLGDYRCADPTWVDKEEDLAALNGEEGATHCKRWEYVTPGKVVGEKLTTVIGYNDHALLDAETLNDSIAAILDAVMARFTSELTNTGIAALTESDEETEDIDLGYLFPPINTTSVGTQFASQYITPWIQNNPNFNLETDLTQALIDEQRTFVDKLESYNKELDALVRTIYQLDYCMPGPHPGWENDSQIVLGEILDGMTTEIPPSETDQIAGSLAGTLDPTGLSSVAFEVALLEDQKKQLSDYLVGFLTNLTNMTGWGDTEHEHKAEPKEAFTFLKTMFTKYKVVSNLYFKDFYKMPFSWRESTEKFKKAEGYKEMILENENRIILQNETIAKLKKLKEQIEDGTYIDFTSTGYAVRQFSRISLNLTNGDDIANVSNLYEQAKEERNYIWNDLIKGPSGCEQEIYNNWIGNNPWQISYVKRPSYPFPILYDYNNYTRGQILPNTPVPAIPGIDFENLSNYQNKEALNPAGSTNYKTFLGSAFMVGDSNYSSWGGYSTYPDGSRVFPNVYSCNDLGLDCGNGHYTDYGALIFETNALHIY